MLAATTMVDLSYQVMNVLPVANGGTGAATANANTGFRGPTSGSAAAPSFRADVASDMPVITSTVGQDGFWINGSPFALGAPANTTGTPTNSTMFVQQLNLYRTEVIGHVDLWVATGGSAETFYTCFYNAAGTSLLWSTSGAINTSSTDVTFALGSQYTAPPGTYMVAYEQTGTTPAVVGTLSSPGVPSGYINLNGTRYATSANKVSGSSCPSSLGTLTANSGAAGAVFLGFEP